MPDKGQGKSAASSPRLRAGAALLGPIHQGHVQMLPELPVPGENVL